MRLRRLLAPDHDRYHGVRPIQICMLRTLYFLMAAFVATEAWSVILKHEGPWDHVRAVAWCVWATYPTLALLGLLHPLRMLPLMLFAIGYKSLWLVVVAFPLWRAGTLAGNPAEEMTRVFLMTPVLIAAVPWGYVLRHYVLPARARVARCGASAAVADSSADSPSSSSSG